MLGLNHNLSGRNLRAWIRLHRIPLLQRGLGRQATHFSMPLPHTALIRPLPNPSQSHYLPLFQTL